MHMRIIYTNAYACSFYLHNKTNLHSIIKNHLFVYVNIQKLHKIRCVLLTSGELMLKHNF